jgi:hypothetical protein
MGAYYVLQGFSHGDVFAPDFVILCPKEAVVSSLMLRLLNSTFTKEKN